MPPEVLAHIAQQGAQTGGDILSTLFNRAFAASDYRKQRRDALADWNRQNEYNSPKQQMQRLSEAGLNPNLVYGGGANAMSTAQIKAPTIQPTHADFKVNNFQDSILRYQNVEQVKQQTNNLRADYENKLEQNKLLGAQTLKTLQDVDARTYDNMKRAYDWQYGLHEISAETQKQGLLNKKLTGQFMISEDSRREMENVRREQKNNADVNLLTSRLGQIAKQNQLTDAQRNFTQKKMEQLQIDVDNAQMTYNQKQAMADIMMNNALIDGMIKGKKVTTEVEDQVIKMFKIRALKMGVSTEYAEKMALSLISLFK